MNFDHIAPVYESIERLVYRDALLQARTALLDELRDAPQRALLIGDGDGRFLHALRERYPGIDAVVVEPSKGMTRVSQRRNPDRARTIWLSSLAEVEQQQFDLVTTHFVFDVLTGSQTVELVNNITSRAAGGTRWLVAEFQQGPSPWKRLLVATMYLFFRVVSDLRVTRVPNFTVVLESCGWKLERRREWWGGFIAAELWQLSPDARSAL